MFTGIIETTAAVRARTNEGLTIERPATLTDLAIGSSVAVNGVCLTVSSLTSDELAFQVVDTTWKKTALMDLHPGDLVNLERALLASGRFDGHVVQGHCEGVGLLTSIEGKGGRDTLMSLSVPRDLLRFIVVHGSIAIDGVSLTVAEIADDVVTVALIPETLARTTLGSRSLGARINIETDLIGRYLLQKHV